MWMVVAFEVRTGTERYSLDEYAPFFRTKRAIFRVVREILASSGSLLREARRAIMVMILHIRIQIIMTSFDKLTGDRAVYAGLSEPVSEPQRILENF